MRSSGNGLAWARLFMDLKQQGRQREQQRNTLEYLNQINSGQTPERFDGIDPNSAIALQDFAVKNAEAQRVAQQRQGINKTYREIANGYTQPGTGPVRPEFMQDGYTPVQTRDFTMPETLSKFARHGDAGMKAYDTWSDASTGAQDRKTLMDFRKQPGNEYAPKLPDLPKPITGTHVDGRGQRVAYSGVPGQPFQKTVLGVEQPSKSLVTNNVNTQQETEEAKAVGKGAGAEYINLQDAGKAALASEAKYRRLGKLLDQAEPGKFRGTTKAIAEVAQAVGFNIDPRLPAAQAAEAISNQLALELRNTEGGAGMPGAMSDKDREFLMRSVPGLTQTPGGIKLLIEYKQKLNQRAKQAATMARAYRQRNGGFDYGFYDQLAAWSAENPMFLQGGTLGGSLLVRQRQPKST